MTMSATDHRHLGPVERHPGRPAAQLPREPSTIVVASTIAVGGIHATLHIAPPHAGRVNPLARRLGHVGHLVMVPVTDRWIMARDRSWTPCSTGCHRRQKFLAGWASGASWVAGRG
jgi:hypothetical protein